MADHLREHRPPVLVVWGRNGPLFAVAGADPYKRDAPNAEVHLLDGPLRKIFARADMMSKMGLALLHGKQSGSLRELTEIHHSLGSRPFLPRAGGYGDHAPPHGLIRA